MRKFLSDNFLLYSEAAEQLYFEHAQRLPIIDYHSHLPPEEIAINKQFSDITEIWLNGDHYKWRAMRAYGIQEKYITGDAIPYEKFEKWGEVVPFTIRNPLFHWTHMELKRPFGIDKLLNKETAFSIYDECNDFLATSNGRVHGILDHFNVQIICTTDDPIDSLDFHREMAKQNFGFKVYPTFRADKVLKIDDAQFFKAYITKLGEAANSEIKTYTDLMDALSKRLAYFHELGCRLSDHGLERMYAVDYIASEVNEIFEKGMSGKSLSPLEVNKFKSAILFDLAVLYQEKGWTQQFHLGALRNNNTRKMRKLGADTGYDSIGDFQQAQSLVKFMDRLDESNLLARTILYNLNPSDNELFATMTGNFNDGLIPGKIQFGSAWWFLDQKEGIEKQLNALSNMGLLSKFVGMLTDSRSFLSFPRHDYFRRILCNMIGSEVEKGELPWEPELLGRIVEDVCYYNAKKYFQLEN